MKRFLALLLAAGLLAVCTGCLSTQSLERYGYVLAIGFDRGEQLPYSVTLLVQKTQTDSESQNNSGFMVVKAECRNLLEGIETLSGGLPLAVNLSRTGMIVAAVELLTEPDFLQELSEIPYARLFIRYNTTLFASVSPAYDTLEGLSNELDPNLSRISLNIGVYASSTGLIPLAHLSLLIEALKGQTFDLALPLCGVTQDDGPLPNRDSVGTREYAYIGGSLALKSEMKTSLAGAALLRDGQMVGYLDGQNVQLMLLASGAFHAGRRRIPDPHGNPVTVHLRADRAPKTKLAIANGTAYAQVEIPISAYVEANRPIDASEREIIAAIERALETDMDALFACCRSLGSDVLGFGKHAVRQFRSTREWEAFDWHTAFMRMEAQFAFDVTLLHNQEETGLE